MATAERVGPTRRVAFAGLVLISSSCLALGKDVDDGDDESAKIGSAPNLYLDLRTNYATIPAGSLSIGLGGFGLFAGQHPALSNLANLAGLSSLPTLPILTSPSSRSIALDVPLTIDLNDRVSLYGGFSAGASRTDLSNWSAFTILSWSAGFQADVYQQNGGLIPTITLQSTLTRSASGQPLATTSVNTILEFDYALNADETRGLLAGVQHTAVAVDTAFVTINPNIVGYVGGYYQWDNNWKFTGRVGVQSFGGAQLLNRTPFEPFIQPIVRLDLDRMDDNDNRTFGVTAQISWVPKPSYQLTVRTPLYLVKN
jgi:opacity protein-like surface antigen